MHDYSKGTLQEALEACRREMSFAAAAKQFSIPQVTLMYLFKSKNKKVGPTTNIGEFQVHAGSVETGMWW